MLYQNLPNTLHHFIYHFIKTFFFFDHTIIVFIHPVIQILVYHLTIQLLVIVVHLYSSINSTVVLRIIYYQVIINIIFVFVVSVLHQKPPVRTLFAEQLSGSCVTFDIVVLQNMLIRALFTGKLLQNCMMHIIVDSFVVKRLGGCMMHHIVNLFLLLLQKRILL